MLDKNGFKRPTRTELTEEMKDKAKELFGETTNVSPRSPLGIIIIFFAFFLDKLYMLAEAVYNNSFPGTATGVSLQRLGKLKGMSLLLEQNASGEIQINGPPNTRVEAGFVVGTETNVLFETTEEVVLNGSGTATVGIYAQEPGLAGNVSAGVITVVVNPTADGLTVTNVEETQGGRDLETDAEFYERFQSSPSKSGSPTPESIKARLLETQGVRDAVVNQNNTRTEQNGLPPNCIAPFVFGGEDNLVARAIFDVAAGGIEIYGTTVINITDSKGTVHPIGFTRPVEIPIYVNIALTKGPEFPGDGANQVRTKVLEYIGGNEADGTIYNGLGLKENVIMKRISFVSMQISGVEDVVVELSTDNVNFEEENITVLDSQVAKTSYDKVVVT